VRFTRLILDLVLAKSLPAPRPSLLPAPVLQPQPKPEILLLEPEFLLVPESPFLEPESSLPLAPVL
jgi:hypothetical protein